MTMGLAFFPNCANRIFGNSRALGYGDNPNHPAVKASFGGGLPLADNRSFMKSLKAYEQIRDMILRGDKLPGSRLVISDLETALGIGRGPIREALMRLDRSGIVRNIPYKGAIVAPPPKRREVTHIFRLRIDIETRLAVEALAHLKAADVRKLEKLHAAMELLPQDHYQHDRQFHTLIYEASGLPHLCNISQALILSVESLLNIYRREREHCLKFNNEHQAILDAIRERNPEKVTRALTVNINSGLSIIEETYNRMLNNPLD